MKGKYGMKKKIKHIEECKKVFEIEVPSADVKKRIEEQYQKVGKAAAIPGYRAGKAPRDLIEKHYGERITREVVEDLISDSYHKAIEESGFIPLTLPSINDVKLDTAQVLSFKAEVTIRPTISLKEYRGLKLKKKRTTVQEGDIEKSVKTLQESSAKFKNLEGRPVQLGDYVVCDSQILIEGKETEAKRENNWMLIEEQSAIPGLAAGLVGTQIGEEKEIETVMPEDFQHKEYANKKAVFKIKVKEIKERVLPQIDDEFAKDLGYNALTDLRDSVKALLVQEAERHVRKELENQALERLLEKSNFAIPSSTAEKQLAYLVEVEKHRLLKQGLKEEDIKSKEKELKERLKPWAVKQVKTMLILSEIAHKENIDISEEELEQSLEAIGQQHNQPKEKVEKYYRDNKLMENLISELRDRKVVEFLLKEANIEEVG